MTCGGDLRDEFQAAGLGVPISQCVDLAKISRWRIGGLASLLVTPTSTEHVRRVFEFLVDRRIPHVIIGETSNLLFDSKGFSGAIVQIGSELAGFKISGNRIRARAGVPVPRLARAAGDAGLSGIEHTVGIPGTLGGLVAMNGGSQRRGIGSNVVLVRCVTGEGELVELTHADCDFRYRYSRLQGLDAIITEVELELSPGDPDAVHREMERVLADRYGKFPSDLPNCGSTFLSNPTMYETVGPPGRVIEQLGFKGRRRGGAEVSTLHANFINNRGNATSDDVLALIAEIRSAVHAETGYLMDCEARHISYDGTVRPAHVAAEIRWPEFADDRLSPR
jgi:UDP-N-acetylmuramate dehydrogenase